MQLPLTSSLTPQYKATPVLHLATESKPWKGFFHGELIILMDHNSGGELISEALGKIAEKLRKIAKNCGKLRLSNPPCIFGGALGLGTKCFGRGL